MGDIPRKASTHLQPLTSPWPFVMWGLSIIGPMPVGSKQCEFWLVGVDYFSKWDEAKPYPKITSLKVRQFFLNEIIVRFGLPKVLVSDNGTQFTSSEFTHFCS